MTAFSFSPLTIPGQASSALALTLVAPMAFAEPLGFIAEVAVWSRIRSVSPAAGPPEEGVSSWV